MSNNKLAPVTEAATPEDVPGADHKCTELGCTIYTCPDLMRYKLDKGRIEEVAPGKFQSNLEVGFDKIDPWVLTEVAKVLERGAKDYGFEAYLHKSPRHHLNHTIAHAYDALKEDPTDHENHFANMICRAIFAYAVYRRTGNIETAVEIKP